MSRCHLQHLWCQLREAVGTEGERRAGNDLKDNLTSAGVHLPLVQCMSEPSE